MLIPAEYNPEVTMDQLPPHEGHGRRGKVNQEEHDAFNPKARRAIAYGRGETKAIKQQFNRKARARENRQIRKLNDE